MSTLNSVKGFTLSYKNVSLDKLLHLCNEYFKLYSSVKIDVVRHPDCYTVLISGEFVDSSGGV